MKIKVYEYGKCSTCRNAIKYLDKKNFSYQKIDITQHPPSRTELKQMLKAYDGDLRRLFNTSGQLYREMKIKDRLAQFKPEEAIQLLAKNGKLIKRPFVLTPKGGRVGFKEQEWKELLSS